MSNNQLTIYGLIVALFIGGLCYFYNHYLTPTPANEIIFANDEIIVHICGAIRKAGVYRLKRGSRLLDVVALAGGGTEAANLSELNLAEGLKDGQKIAVPEKTRKPVGNTLPSGKNEKSTIVSLNSALLEELDKLPGIGKKTAEKIIQNRPYRSIDDLKKIPRFGEKRIDELKDKVSL